MIHYVYLRLIELKSIIMIDNMMTQKGSTFLCPTSSDRNQSDSEQTPNFHSDSERFQAVPIGFRVEIVCSESDRFRVDSDRNLRLFFLKNSLFVFFYLIYTIY